MLRVAVLGAGRIGKIHAKNIALMPKCNLTGIADIFEPAAEALAAVYGCVAENDPSRLLRRNDVDAVVICTPTDTHVEYMLEAARLGKAVLCEKPVDVDLGRAVEAAAEVKKLNARIMVGFNRRFDPTAIALKRAIDEGEVGDVRQVLITSRDPGLPNEAYIRHSGGIFRDMVIHDFDMGRFLLGEEPVEIQATSSCLVDNSIAALGDADTVMIIMRTASGKQCHINCCRETAYGYDQRFEIFGSLGMLLNDNVRADTVRRYSRGETERRGPLLYFFTERYEEAYRNELEYFTAAIFNETPMPVTVQDGVQALRLAEAALTSSQTGRVVTIGQ